MFQKIANVLSIVSFLMVASMSAGAYFAYKYVTSPQLKNKIMKTTKRIKNLSLAMAKEDIKTSTFWKEKDLDQLTKWNAETLTKIKNAL